MRFGEYLEARAVVMAAAGVELGCSESYVSRLAAGLADPSMKFARRVEAWSRGAVTLADWPEPAARAA